MTPTEIVYDDEPPAPARRGGWLISALVLGGIVGVGLMILVPAVNAARDAARQSVIT